MVGGIQPERPLKMLRESAYIGGLRWVAGRCGETDILLSLGGLEEVTDVFDGIRQRAGPWCRKWQSRPAGETVDLKLPDQPHACSMKSDFSGLMVIVVFGHLETRFFMMSGTATVESGAIYSPTVFVCPCATRAPNNHEFDKFSSSPNPPAVEMQCSAAPCCSFRAQQKMAL